MVRYGRRPAGVPDPGQVAALGLGFVSLDPDRRVDQVHAFPAGGPDALDDQQRAARRDLDRPRALALVPRGRPERHRPPGPRWLQDAADQQVGPAEPGMPPGDVIGVHDRRSRHGLPEPRRQRRLAAGTAAVHGHHDRPVPGPSVPAEPHHGAGHLADQLRTPRPRFGLLRSKPQPHSDQSFPSRPPPIPAVPPDPSRPPQHPGAPSCLPAHRWSIEPVITGSMGHRAGCLLVRTLGRPPPVFAAPRRSEVTLDLEPLGPASRPISRPCWKPATRPSRLRMPDPARPRARAPATWRHARAGRRPRSRRAGRSAGRLGRRSGGAGR